MRRSLLLRLAGAVAMVAALVLAVPGAHAQPTHPDAVSPRPADWTPHILDGTVHAVTVVGNTVVVGGTFTAATDATGQFQFSRHYLLAFGRQDGRMSELEVRLDGPVHALAPGPDGTVYLGGQFRTVNGVAQRGVAQVRVADGSRVPGFRAAINWGSVATLASHGDHLYLGGNFTAVGGAPRAGVARVDSTSGEVDPGFDAQLTFDGGDRVSVQELALAPGGDRLVAVGAFSHADGWMRPQIVMMDTAGAQASLANWYTDAYERRCAPFFLTYLRGVAFSPDGSYLVAVTTGGTTGADRTCNTAARFEATGTGMHRPTWVNHTGGNSLYAVAISGAAVYVGGHQQWQDNPHGNKFAGPGAVPREGIAALHPGTGKALPWNPGRARGVGVQAFHVTPEGLYVGSDTTRIGGVYRGRIAFLPMAD